MKKIVFMHPVHWEQAMGGAELQISYLVKHFSKLGYIVHYIYEDLGSLIENEDCIALHPLKRIKIKGYWGKRYCLYSSKILKILEQIKPDYIYTRTYLSWSGLASIYSKNNHIDHIWAIANDDDPLNSKILKKIIYPLNIIEALLIKKAFKYASHIVVQNSTQKNLIESRYNRKCVQIMQMSPIDGEKNIKKGSEFINIVWIANFKPIKNPEYFLELVWLFKNHKRCKFFMIGRMGAQYLSLVNDLSKSINNFQYLGELTNKEVNNILLKSHILVNTSNSEGFSNTFVQAWMRGVIVLSMNSNPDDIIRLQKIGFMCPTINDIKINIERLVDDTRLRLEMMQKAKEYSIKNHSLEKNINRVIDLL